MRREEATGTPEHRGRIMNLPQSDIGDANALDAVKHVLDTGGIDPARLGNPAFTDDGRYTQDVATPLPEAFNAADPTEAQQLVDEYLVCVRRGWEAGIAVNEHPSIQHYGVDARGRVIFHDLETLTHDRYAAAATVRHHAEAVTQLREHCSNEVQHYYREQAEAVLTDDCFNALWPGNR